MVNWYGGKMKRLVHPSNGLISPLAVDAVSMARRVVVPTAQILLSRAAAALKMRLASSVTSICSESALCFVRSSTSISRNMPSEA